MSDREPALSFSIWWVTLLQVASENDLPISDIGQSAYFGSYDRGLTPNEALEEVAKILDSEQSFGVFPPGEMVEMHGHYFRRGVEMRYGLDDVAAYSDMNGKPIGALPASMTTVSEALAWLYGYNSAARI